MAIIKEAKTLTFGDTQYVVVDAEAREKIAGLEQSANETLPALKQQIETHSSDNNAHSDIRDAIPTKVSQLANDSQFITQESDPTVPAWAKQETKPEYTASEVGAEPAGTSSTVVSQHNTSNVAHADIRNEIKALNDEFASHEHNNAYDSKGSAESALTEAKSYTDSKTANLASTSSVNTSISNHNTNAEAHNDIRLELKAINDRLNAFFDSDDKTLDELSEIVAYITNNKTLIDSITTSKVNVEDIINNLTTNVVNKPLSAAQGVALKGLIDSVSTSLSNYQPKGNYALKSELPTKVSQLSNDSGYLTEHQDISGKLDSSALPTAINTALAQAKESGEFDGKDGIDGKDGKDGQNGQDGKTPQKGVDYFTESDKQEIAEQAAQMVEIPEVNFDGYATEEFVKNKIAEAELGGEEVDLSGYAQKSELPTKVSQLENDKGYLTEHQDISGKLNASELPAAINTALSQAKESGEFDGEDGQNGVSATHSWNGTTLTITSASGTSSADLKGDKGDKGDSVKGDKGDTGNDGVSPTVAVSKSGKVTTVSITDKNGTKTATINDGADGSAGSAGKDGTSVTVKSVSESTADGGSNVVTFSDGNTLTVKNGSKGSKGDKGDKGDTGMVGAAGYTPQKGTDYFTEADKQEIAEQAAGMVEIPDYAGYVVQDTAPEDTTAMWVDLNDNTDDGFQEAVNMALAQAKASGEFDGEKGDKGDKGDEGNVGQRGTGLLPVTTAPSSYTTAVGGITPKYRMEISTIKTQSGAVDVLLGDTVRYSYYHYPIAYLNATYAYFTTRVSIRGATGKAPVVGTDYFTEADKTEIVNAVLAALPVYAGEVV